MDIKEVTQDSLHKHIAIIPQDVCLFNRTLLENIRYGKTDASEAEVVKAARQASADKFIEKFAGKYNTKVGDRGVILSGGERQRIAIARAILKNAPILIFDEATSSLDSESEKYIQASLKTLMKNKTVVAIAHRCQPCARWTALSLWKTAGLSNRVPIWGCCARKGVTPSYLKCSRTVICRQPRSYKSGLIPRWYCYNLSRSCRIRQLTRSSCQSCQRTFLLQSWPKCGLRLNQAHGLQLTQKCCRH